VHITFRVSFLFQMFVLFFNVLRENVAIMTLRRHSYERDYFQFCTARRRRFHKSKYNEKTILRHLLSRAV